jgi:hypothetical protein
MSRKRYAARAVFVFGVSALLLSALMFAPIPTIDVSDDESQTQNVETVEPEPLPTSTSVEIQLTTTDGYMTQDARAIVPAVAVGAVALSSGVAGTLIGKEYFSKSAGDDFEAYYLYTNLEDRIKGDLTNIDNSYEPTRTMAYRIAETEFAEEMANGSSKTVAQANATKAVNDYLSKVINDEIVRRNNAYVSTIDSIQSFRTIDVGENIDGFTRKNEMSLPNGSTVNATETRAGGTGGTFYGFVSGNSILDVRPTLIGAADGPDSHQIDLPNVQRLSTSYNEYKSISSEVETEIASFSDSVSKSQYENLSADEIVSPVNQALEWGENYNQTGSSGYASALASTLGYDVAETGTMYHVKMPANGSTWYNGTVYADESTIPNQTITTGKVYDGSSTTAYVATSSGTTTLNEDWMVVDIETRTGETLNQTELSTWSRDSLNASSPLETLEKWQELKEEAGSGGGGGLGSGLVGGGIGLIALLGAAFLLMRDGEDGSGGSTVVLGGGGRGRN